VDLREQRLTLGFNESLRDNLPRIVDRVSAAMKANRPATFVRQSIGVSLGMPIVVEPLQRDDRGSWIVDPRQ
jgi:hypothetical protein